MRQKILGVEYFLLFSVKWTEAWRRTYPPPCCAEQALSAKSGRLPLMGIDRKVYV